MSQSIKLYYIIHIEQLVSILETGRLLSDYLMRCRKHIGPAIGMYTIKERRLKTPLRKNSALTIGQCVPFYFAPRSVMLYNIFRKDPALSYRGGQEQIVHLVFDLNRVLQWAHQRKLYVCYTDCNAAAGYHQEYTDFTQIKTILNWQDIEARYWNQRDIKDHKQSECLIENEVDITLLEQIGVKNDAICQQVKSILNKYNLSIAVGIYPFWYY